MKRVHVVAGIIWNDEKTEILISQRPQHLHKGGFWEFPGGKIESSESEEDALARELHEELNVSFLACEKFKSIDYDYIEKLVSLHFYHVYGVSGEVKSNEGQQFRWVALAHLNQFQFPEANQTIVNDLLDLV